MKRTIIFLVILAAAGGGGYYYYTYGSPPEKPQVIQVTASQGDIVEEVQSTGTLEALRVAPVGSQVSGVVKALHADFNSIVRKDQVIAEIDPSLFQVQVDLQMAAYERQLGEIANQEVQLENDKKNLERTEQLFAKALVNQQQLEQAQLQVKTRTTQLESARKTLKTQEANVNQAKLNLSYTIIRSPIDGVVVNRSVDVGQAVQSSMNVAQFFVLATDLRELKINAGVDEAEIGKIRPGMPVTFTVDSYQGTTFHGEVDTVRLNASNQNNVVTYPVWIKVDNADLKLRPAMTATVRIRTASAPNVIRIPNQALRFRPTSDMYMALGLTPPAAGRGLATGGPVGGDGRRSRGDTPGGGNNDETANRPAAGPGQSQRQPGQAAQAGSGERQRPAGGQSAQAAQGARMGGGRGTGGQGQGFGRGSFANMSPEDRQRMMESLGMRGGGGRGGRGGGQQAAGQGGGGRGGGRGGRGAAPANVDVEPTPLNAEKIDELFQPTPVRVTPGTVWTWDEANRKLTEIRVTTGLADNQFSQLLTVVSADAKITPGMQLVSSIIVPLTSAQRAAQNPLFGGQRGNFGGMQPGQRGGDNQQQRGGQGGGGNLGFGNMGGGRGGGRGN